MAIDTQDKRRSALLEGVLPVADGTVGQGDRPHVVWIYRGLDFTAIVTVAGTVHSPQLAGTVHSPQLAGTVKGF